MSTMPVWPNRKMSSNAASGCEGRQYAKRTVGAKRRSHWVALSMAGSLPEAATATRVWKTASEREWNGSTGRGRGKDWQRGEGEPGQGQRTHRKPT